MLARVSFEDAVMAMWGHPVRRGFFCDYADLKRALIALGLTPADRAMRTDSFGWVTERSIVACQLRSNGNWHWVIWDPVRGRLYDPRQAKRVKLPINQVDRRYRPFSRLAVPS